MSAKTCLQCGKTLVFIRVGAGGDFCSREHRNQYQLRRGMDCLAEANKVATLARRRETPKALFGEAAPGSSGAVARSFSDAAAFGLLAGLRPGLRRPGKSVRPNVLPRAEGLYGLVPETAPRGERREFAVKFAGSIPAAAFRGARAGWKPTGLAGKAVRGLRGIAVSAAPGNALRVSSSAGFHLKAADPRRRVLALRKPAAGIAALGGRAAPLAFSPPQERPGTPPDARFGFIDMGFSTAQDAPARLAWLQAGRIPAASQEQKEL